MVMVGGGGLNNEATGRGKSDEGGGGLRLVKYAIC